MTLASGLKKSLKAITFIWLAVHLFIIGLVMTLYSPWFQDVAREKVVTMLNRDPHTRFDLESFRLTFPLNIEVGGLSMATNGDTLVRADKFEGHLAVLPLLFGEVYIDRATLIDGYYKMGNHDSLTCITLNAKRVELNPAKVKLSPMKIDLKRGSISDATVDIWLNPIDTLPATPPTPATPLNVNIQDLDIKNLTYRMNMLPTIDSLGTTIGSAHLSGGKIDLVKQTVDISKFVGEGLSATYIAADSLTSARVLREQALHPTPPDTFTTMPWTVNIKLLDFKHSQALYTTRGITPVAGFDPAYIALDSLSLTINNFYNRQEVVKLPIEVSGLERCGVFLSANGVLGIDATGLNFDNIALSTANGTWGSLNGTLGISNPDDMTLDVAASISAAPNDMALMFPVAGTYIKPLLPDKHINLDAVANGSMNDLSIDKLTLDIGNMANLAANGNIKNAMTPASMSGAITFDGTIANARPWQKMFLPADGSVIIPPLTVKGDATFSNTAYSADFVARTMKGKLSAAGSLRGKGNVYDMDIDAADFPVNAFMPTMGIGNVSARLSAKGQGFDFTKSTAESDIDLDINSIEYQGTTYRDIRGTISLHENSVNADLTSTNPALDFSLQAEGTVLPEGYNLNATVDGRSINLKTLKVSDTDATLSLDARLSASYEPKSGGIDAKLRVNELNYVTPPASSIYIDDVTMYLNSNDSVTNVSVRNRDLYAYFSTPNSLDSLATRFSRTMTTLDAQVQRRHLDIIELQQQLPQFNLDIDGGRDNLLTQTLADSDIAFKSLSINAANDTVVTLDARMLGLQAGQIKMDTVNFNVRQAGNRLDYIATVGNRPGTFDAWAHAKLHGFFEPGRLGLSLQQENIKGKTGFNIGANINFDSKNTMTLHFDPLYPTIGYQDWTVNEDNYVTYNFLTKHLDANLRMKSAISSLALFTEHAGETDHDADNSTEDLVLQMSDINIQDWVTLNPFAPPVKGVASADMRVNWTGTALTANGYVGVNNLIYGKERVGDFRADVDVLTQSSGFIRAKADLWVDSVRTITIAGVLNDTTRTTPFNLDFSMIRFPLKTLNPFLPGIAKLGGSLNGSMDVSGDMEHPKFNGNIAFENATVGVNMLGSTFTFSNDSVPVVDNVVMFKNFAIKGCNANPLTISGTADVKALESPYVDLKLNANNMQIVNSSRASKGAEVYGKAFVSLNATARGNLEFMRIGANVSLMPGTNVTYVMTDATTALQSRANEGMVKFVNFTDTLSVLKADSITDTGMAMAIDAVLNIQSGTTVSVDLSSNGTNKAQVQAQGTLNYTMNPGNEGRLTGRLNINSGFVRYTPPLMSEKNFKFNPNSYVAFNGDMMNPQLNVSATDDVRANVTQEGQNSRLINFDVGLSVTGTLNNMNVAFDLSTDDDVTIANELSSMTQSQRANQAMNLLIYNVYTGPGTKANANLSGSPLYSFLTSQINNWAASAIKGVDLSFGIDQYDTTVGGNTSSTMSYSYRVSKSLFNDRFKIVIGGNYATDASADENLSQNLINDISFEYYMNDAHTMLVKIFRHTGYESILEGEITQTGVGFVYKRKIRRIADMFLPRRFRRSARDKETTNPESKDDTTNTK